MREKIKTICLVLITISIIIFSVSYGLRALIDYGCSTPKFYKMEENKTGLERFISRSFLGVRCILWEKLLQIQQNF